MTTDLLINLEDDIPNEVIIEDGPLTQQLKLISQIEEDDWNEKKFQDFFQKNLPATQ